MINTKKEVVDAVKETLQPFFKDFNLSHDDFKNIAKTATNKIASHLPTSSAQVHLSVYETVSEIRPSSLSDDGWGFLRRQTDQTHAELMAGSNNNNIMDNGDDDQDYLTNGSGNSDSVTSKFRVSGDEKITMEKLNQFVTAVKQAQLNEDLLSGRRRQRI